VHKKDWDGADAAFMSVLKLHPDDGPATFYRARLPELRTETLPDEWQGEIELKEK